jgi:glyoxylate reductase
MKPQLLIARAIFPEVLQRLSEYFDIEANQEDLIYSQNELSTRLKGKFGMICTSSAKINQALLEDNQSLKIISTIAVGYDNFDLDACTKYRVLATNAPDVLNETTADFAWALLMATARRVTEAEHWLRAGLWEKWRYDLFMGAEVHGSTLGILGMGRIGRAIARRAAGFGMNIIYHNRSRLSESVESEANGAKYVSFDELLANADHLVLALPYAPGAHHIIGAAQLARMKPSATLINIARGGLVDDAALIDALVNKKIAAAGLDVFENEPRFDVRFLSLPNVVLTPHIASASKKTRLAMCQTAANNVIAAAEGRTPPNLLNVEVNS